MIEPGLYIKDNNKNYLVGACKEYKEKYYAFMIDEENEIGFFAEVLDEGTRFNKIESESLSKLLMLEFSDIKSIIENELKDE